MAIEQIEEIKQSFTEGVNVAQGHKKAATKTLLNNAGILVGVFIVFAVITIVTTDIKLADPAKIGQLGIDFFYVLFVDTTSGIYLAGHLIDVVPDGAQ